MNERQRLIEIIEKARTEAVSTIGSMNNGFAAWYADKLIEAGVTFNQWIPVHERLPEPKVKVAIFTRSRAIYLGWHANHGGIKGFETAVGFIQLGRITHWMPLPEPPKEES